MDKLRKAAEQILGWYDGDQKPTRDDIVDTLRDGLSGATEIQRAAKAVENFFFEFISGESGEPDRVTMGEFGELMSQLSDALFFEENAL